MSHDKRDSRDEADMPRTAPDPGDSHDRRRPASCGRIAMPAPAARVRPVSGPAATEAGRGMPPRCALARGRSDAPTSGRQRQPPLLPGQDRLSSR